MTFGTLPRLHFMQRDHAVPRLLERWRDISLPLVGLVVAGGKSLGLRNGHGSRVRMCTVILVIIRQVISAAVASGLTSLRA